MASSRSASCSTATSAQAGGGGADWPRRSRNRIDGTVCSVGGGIREFLRGRSRSRCRHRRGHRRKDRSRGHRPDRRSDDRCRPRRLSSRPIVVVTGRSDAELDIASQGWASLLLWAPSRIECARRRERPSNQRRWPEPRFQRPRPRKTGNDGPHAAHRFQRRVAADFWPPIMAGSRSIWPAGCRGLGADAQIIVEVNGRSAGSVGSIPPRREFPPQATFPAAERIPSRAKPY